MTTSARTNTSHESYYESNSLKAKTKDHLDSPSAKNGDANMSLTREEYLSLQQQQERQAAMGPRSSSEQINDSTPKFRQLPCRTFISVGTCPYRERCVYLHDPRIICREAKTKTRRKNKEDTVVDSLFWPIMPYGQVASKLDSNRQPHVIQSYVVPSPQQDQFYRHDQAVYSMWMHFVDFCSACNAFTPSLSSGEVKKEDTSACFQAPDLPCNAYTNAPRLPIFRALSNNQSVGKSLDQIPQLLKPAYEEEKPRSDSPTTVTRNFMSPLLAHSMVHSLYSHYQ